MSNEDAIAKLIQCLNNDSVMLFIGSGFSLGATNGNGEKLPSGAALKKDIIEKLLGYKDGDCDYAALTNEKLPAIISLANSTVQEVVVHDYLTETFKDCSPCEFHKTIANFPWKKVYTTNIDDVFENSIRPGQYIVQNMHRLQNNSKNGDKPQYFKLHGCVRNPEGKYIFSSDDYEEEVLSRDSSLMHSFAIDIQTNNFIFVGFDYNELDINTYLKQYKWRNGAAPGAKLFFINPNQNIIFKNKVDKLKGIIINQTAEGFAQLISKLSISKRNANNQSARIEGFNLVNDIINGLIKKGKIKSRLLYGDFPSWNDICFNWDCKHPVIKTVLGYISDVTSKHISSSAIVSLYGDMLIGKSVFLKRIGYELIRDDFQVYEIAKRDFDLNLFLRASSQLPSKKIALLVDNAPFFYSQLAKIIEDYPQDKQLVVITVGRTYFHKKQVYAFRQLPYHGEFRVDPFSYDNRTEYAKEIDKKLYEKGLLGYLQNKKADERIKEILKYSDICTLLHSLTDSYLFRSKFIANYTKDYKNIMSLRQSNDILLALAMFQELDIPSFPLEILALWKRASFTHVLNVISDYTRKIDEDSIALRNSFLTRHLLNNASEREKSKTLSSVLKLIAPQRPSYGRNMWSMMQEKLMGFRTLTKTFHLTADGVRSIYNEILQNYNTDYNYWIQVGIADQEDQDYISAHNHLTQAENLNSRSYLVRHALARNYLLRAISGMETNISEANYNKGKNIMLRLIEDREGDQTKAYSIHSYVIYSVKYWRKYSINPTKSEIDQMIQLLKTLNSNGQNDVKTANAEQILFKFLNDKNISIGLTLNWNELGTLKSSMLKEGVDAEVFLADEYPE